MTKEEIREIVEKAKISKDILGRFWWEDNEYTRENLEAIRAAKQEIIAYVEEREAAKRSVREERERRINEIEGLKEIQEAREALERWQWKFDRSFEGEYACGGMGCGPRPKYDFEAAYQRYPRAAAYLKCEREANSNHWELSAIGQRALEEVIYGDYEKALATLDREISEFVQEHIWD